MPMLIGGWDKNAKELCYGGFMICPSCSQACAFTLLELATRIKVYFVPVAKFGKKYYLQCASCEAAFEIKKDEANEILAVSSTLPDVESVLRIWNTIDARFALLMKKHGGAPEELESVLDEVASHAGEHFPQDHVSYVMNVYVQWLASEAGEDEVEDAELVE